MSDPGLLSIDPYPGGLDRFLFIHNKDHENLTSRANFLTGGTLEFRILDPIPARIDDWLLDHQKSHDELAAITGVIGSDLLDVDFKNAAQREAWISINQLEHAAFAAILGI